MRVVFAHFSPEEFGFSKNRANISEGLEESLARLEEILALQSVYS